jgi:hypothetical protein
MTSELSVATGLGLGLGLGLLKAMPDFSTTFIDARLAVFT